MTPAPDKAVLESLLSMQVTENGRIYPFIESESANITGYGHQDPAEFAAAVNDYDTECNGEPMREDDQWEPGDIGHDWVVIAEDQESFRVATADEPGAVPVTVLWGQR